MPSIVNLGPWKLGKNNVENPSHKVFQVPGQGEPLAQLVEAMDVDIDDEGWVQTRPGTSSLATLTAGKRAYSSLGLLLVHDSDKIVSINPSTGAATTRVSGISTTHPVQFHTFGGQIYWTNRVQSGRILAAGTALNWGMAAPPSPTLTTTAGDLPAGRYLVAATYTDASGVESGAGKVTAITVDGTKDISATLVVNDTNATNIRFYISGPDGTEVFWTKTVAVAAVPTTLTNEKLSRFPLKTQHMTGPVPGSGVFSYKGIIGTHYGNWVFLSSGLSPHLFSVQTDSMQFPYLTRAVAGVAGGIWVATEGGLFWVQGGTVQTMAKTQKDNDYYARGTIVLPGTHFPMLETSDEVAFFVKENSIVAGTSDGRAIPITLDRYRPGTVTEKQASFAYGVRNGLRQLRISLTASVVEAALT